MIESSWTYPITIITAVISSGGIWGFLQFLMTRKNRKQDLEKEAQEIRKRKLEEIQATEERAKLLADAQQIMQRSALESAAERFDNLHKDYQECLSSLRDVRSATSMLIEAFLTFLGKAKPRGNGESFTATFTLEEVAQAKVTINEANRHLYPRSFHDSG